MLKNILGILNMIEQEKNFITQKKEDINTKIQKIKAIKVYIEQNE